MMQTSGLNSGELFQQLIPYFQTYGYYVLFLGLLLENTVIIGLFLPGETILLAGAFLAARGVLSINMVFIIGIIAAFLGNMLGYLLGRAGGFAFVKRFGDRLHISPARIKSAEQYFAIHGGKTVFVGRFATFVRVFISIIAGASNMPLLPFAGYTAAAVLVWTLVLCLLGFYFGQNWELLAKLVAGFGWFILIFIVGAGVFIWWRKKR